MCRSKGSPSVPVGGQTPAEVLHARRRAWAERPLTREVYRRYYRAIRDMMVAGPVNIELGGGAGLSREFVPGAFVTDIVQTRFVDAVVDAMRLPFRDGAADNLFMLDVLHHLPRPAEFLREAVRVLRPGGRLVMVEPYISPVSRLVFRLAHPEPVDMRTDPLPAGGGTVFQPSGPFAANQALPTLLFVRQLDRLLATFPRLRLAARRLDSTIVYPLSGGFSGPCLVPAMAHRWIWFVERLTSPLRRLMAFRLLVALERV